MRLYYHCCCCAQHILSRFYETDVCLVVGSFQILFDVTASDSVYVCYVRSRCVLLSNHWIMHVCFLYDDESKLYFESEEAISGCFNNFLNIIKPKRNRTAGCKALHRKTQSKINSVYHVYRK